MKHASCPSYAVVAAIATLVGCREGFGYQEHREHVFSKTKQSTKPETVTWCVQLVSCSKSQDMSRGGAALILRLLRRSH